MKLHIAEDLALPIEAVTQTFAILAKRGVGKTHAASVMAEEMLKVGQPIVVYDPTGAWYGLKSSKDGRHAGYPVVIFGGEHGDVPLEETAGATIASVIVEKRFPAILDCGLLRKGARIRFMTDFCETLYHKNRDALHFFVDEVQTIAPQNLKTMPEAARLLGAMEDIVMQGRRRGLGLTIISPRPAVVNTNLRSACEVIVAMQIVGPHDRKAIRDWVDLHGDDEKHAKDMMDSLSSLKRGEAWVWSPSWLGLFKKIHFRDRETFDSSATPAVGHKIAAPRKMAEIDLASLGDQIKATVEKAKADDPKTLRAEIKRLQQELAKKPAVALPAQERIVEKIVEKPVLKNGQLQKTERVADRTEAMGQRLIDEGQKFLIEAGELRRVIAPAFAKVAAPPAPPRPTPAPIHKPKPTNPEPVRRPTPVAEGEREHKVGTGGKRRMLVALAQRPQGMSARQLGVRAGLSSGSGSFSTYLGELRSPGWIVGSRERLQITDAGLTALGEYEPLPTGQALLDYWLRELGDSGLARMLRALADVYPDALTKDALGEAAGMSVSSGSFSTYLGKLRSLELCEGKAEITASAELFD